MEGAGGTLELPDAQFHQLMGLRPFYVGWFWALPFKEPRPLLMFAWAKICSLISGKERLIFRWAQPPTTHQSIFWLPRTQPPTSIHCLSDSFSPLVGSSRSSVSSLPRKLVGLGPLPFPKCVVFQSASIRLGSIFHHHSLLHICPHKKKFVFCINTYKYMLLAHTY